MQNRFFIRAIAAAKKSSEAFAAEFSKIDANADAKEWIHWSHTKIGSCTEIGMSLLHKILINIPDENLPAILAILVKHNVNLEARELGIDEKPLATAARYHKLNAINFLLEHKVEVNDPKSPALCTVMQFHLGDASAKDIVKNLLGHGANINMCLFGESPLFRATEQMLPETLSLLISKGADLFLTSDKLLSGSHTAISLAYKMKVTQEIDIRERNPYMKPGHPFIKPTQKCFELLLQATKDFLYRQGMSFAGSDENLELHLAKYIDELSGNFFERDEVNSDKLKKLLVQDILTPVLTTIKADQKRGATRLESGARLHSGKVRLWSFAEQTNIHREDKIRANNVYRP